MLQAFVASRLVKYAGLRGALLALPLIALGGYATIAAGASFALVRWIKTAENATDYSIMNTARQLLWLPTSREEKYKAKQAIDTFFVRGGDLLSAAVVYVGARRMGIAGFAAVNVALTLVWIGVALLILRHHRALTRLAPGPLVGVLVAVAAIGMAAPAQAQQGSGVRESGSQGVRDQGSGSRDQGAGVREQGSGIREQGSGGSADQGLGIRRGLKSSCNPRAHPSA